MIKKVIYITEFIFILLIGWIIFAVIDYNKNKVTTIQNETKTEIDYNDIFDENGYFTDEYIEKQFGERDLTNDEKAMMSYYTDHINEMVLEMMKKGNRWRCFPVAKEIKNKYHEYNGLLAEYNFDRVEYSQDTLDLLSEYGNAGEISVIGNIGKQYKKVFMSIRTNGGLEEFRINKVVDLTDEYGNELDTRLKFNNENFKDIIIKLMSSSDMDLNKIVTTTENFKSKYEDFTDIFFKQYKPQSSYHTIYKNVKIDEENLTADFYWISDEVERLYRAHFILDERNYIDDIEIEVLE